MKSANELRHQFYVELSVYYDNKELKALFFWCVEHVFKWSRSQCLLRMNDLLPEYQIIQFLDIINRLKKHEPIQYIVGESEFCGMSFQVNPSCLIPRPETEELVNWILQYDFNSALDIGTGSGCIATALAKQTKAKISALDVCQDAIELAKANAKLNQARVTFFVHDIFEPLSLESKWDLIVSNPPYVMESERTMMSKNVLDYEPKLALFVDDHIPLIFYDRIVQLAKENLNDHGLLFFEINEQKSIDVANLLENNDFCDILIKNDMQGKNRMVKAQKMS